MSVAGGRLAGRMLGSYLLLGLGDVLLETSGMSATTQLAPAACRAVATPTMHPVH